MTQGPGSPAADPQGPLQALTKRSGHLSLPGCPKVLSEPLSVLPKTSRILRGFFLISVLTFVDKSIPVGLNCYSLTDDERAIQVRQDLPGSLLPRVRAKQQAFPSVAQRPRLRLPGKPRRRTFFSCRRTAVRFSTQRR